MITQLGLNVLLNLNSYFWGSVYLLLVIEIIIFVVEALLYNRRFAAEKKGHPILYAFVANLISFAAGLFLAYYVPQFF